jgi:hypothetical protein
VNFPPVTDGEIPDHPGFAIQFVDDTKALDFRDRHRIHGSALID